MNEDDLSLSAAVELHMRILEASLQMLQSGCLRTSKNGHDTTNDSISQTMGWIDDLRNAPRAPQWSQCRQLMSAMPKQTKPPMCAACGKRRYCLKK